MIPPAIAVAGFVLVLFELSWGMFLLLFGVLFIIADMVVPSSFSSGGKDDEKHE